MQYVQSHLRQWLLEHPLINISGLEKSAQVPKDTLRQFIKERQNLPKKHIGSIEEIIIAYGYIPLEQE